MAAFVVSWHDFLSFLQHRIHFAVTVLLTALRNYPSKRPEKLSCTTHNVYFIGDIFILKIADVWVLRLFLQLYKFNETHNSVFYLDGWTASH